MKKQSKIFIIYFLTIITLLCAGCKKNPPEVTPIASPMVTEIITEPTTPIMQVNKIEVNPESQEINEHGSCIFIAKCSNNLQGTWYFVSPDWDAQYTVENIKTYAKDLRVTVNDNVLYLINVPKTMGGWMVYCEFPGGLITTTATITVNYRDQWEIDPYANKEF